MDMTFEAAVEALADALRGNVGIILLRRKDLDIGHDWDRAAKNLLDWYNVVGVDAKDLNKLFRLFVNGRFEAWSCPTCEATVYKANPENWDDFQGVLQVDYVSYPVSENQSERQCDHCRMHLVLMAGGKRAHGA